MSEIHKIEYSRLAYLMEKMRIIILADQIEERKSVFYGYAKEARECADKILSDIEGEYLDIPKWLEEDVRDLGLESVRLSCAIQELCNKYAFGRTLILMSMKEINT